MTSNKRSRPIPGSALAMTNLMRMLRDEGGTVEEGVEVSGLHRETVGRWMRVWHREKLTYIIDWVPDKLGRARVPVYKIGRGTDARVEPMSSVERTRRHREKKRKLSLQQAIIGATT